VIPGRRPQRAEGASSLDEMIVDTCTMRTYVRACFRSAVARQRGDDNDDINDLE